MGNSNLEEYRFLFLSYLSVAIELVKLKSGQRYVEDFRQTFGAGKIFDAHGMLLQEHAAEKAGQFLASRYDLEYSIEGFEMANKQFEAELAVLSRQEKTLWADLVEIVKKISPADTAWYEGSVNNQHTIMYDIFSPTERLLFYQQELKRFDEKPLLPGNLEDAFCFYRSGLMHLVPFN